MTGRMRNRIAFKQALIVLRVSLLLGLFLISLQIWLDHRLEHQTLARDIERIVEIHRENASQAVYNLNARQANDIVRTLVADPHVHHALLVDDFGDTLAEIYSSRAEASLLTSLGSILFHPQKLIEIPLQVEVSKSGLAKLIIELDTIHIATNFASRAIVNVALGLLFVLILTVTYLLLFYRYLSEPIQNISKWIHQLHKSEAAIPPPYSERDELGDLVYDFARLWQENKETNDRLNDTIEELSQSEYFSRSLMENAGDAMFLCLPDTTIVQVNNQACDTLKLASSEITGYSLAEFSQNFDQAELQKLFISIGEREPTTYEDIQISQQNESFPIEARGIRLSLYNKSYIMILARDISVRKEAEQQVYELAFYDTLTGLPNRRLFIDRLNSTLILHQTSQSYGAVLYLDLDRFKTINDSLGHGIGDKLLCEVARRLQEQLPDGSTCARFGGDEFVILLPDAGQNSEACAEHAATLAVNILEHMGMPLNIDGHLLYCSTSIGIAVFPDQSLSSLDILRHADTALYRVKALGRNGFQFFDPEMQSSAQERLEVEKGLHQALENNEFEIWYQPQVNNQNRIIGAEALLRWHHPERGIIAPGEFIQIAEDSGQIVEIGRWVLEHNLQQLKQCIKQGLPESFQRLAINISPMQFMQVDFVDHLFQLLDNARIPGHMIELEITENMLLNNFEVASNKMKLLKQLGISFSIDDFGTGYSSLTYLRHLPLDVLKIDRSFVTDLTPSSEEAAIVQVIIATAERLKLSVIAEGVETESEKNALQQLGCSCFQGYLFSRPVPANSLYKQLQQVEQTETNLI